MKRLEGKVALVTGGSRGIGSAVCLRLAAEGAAVVVNYAGSQSSAQELASRIIGDGGKALALRADVADPAQCSALVEETHSQFGSLDIVVNNAGIARDGLVVRMSDEDWDAVIRTNLTGVFSVTRAAAKIMMKQRSGSIINMASVVGLTGNAGQVNYAAAKAGVIGLTKSVARELASRSVRVNAIAPGFIETDMTAELSEKVCDAARAQIAMGVFGTPEDIAAAVAFLASDDARYITGQTLAVDGGMTFV